jgi:hypothetical protein
VSSLRHRSAVNAFSKNWKTTRCREFARSATWLLMRSWFAIRDGELSNDKDEADREHRAL